MKRYFVGIDIGTHSSRGILLDENFQVAFFIFASLLAISESASLTSADAVSTTFSKLSMAVFWRILATFRLAMF